MKNRILKHTTHVLSAILVGGLVACSGAQEESKSEESVKRVETALSETRNVAQEMDFTGNVKPLEQNVISPAMQMRIESIFVEVGDQIKKGQLLVQMDLSQLQQTRVRLENLEKEFTRLDTLHKAGSVSQQQLDQLKTELDVTRSSYQNLKENTRLVAPISGIITARNYENGDMFSMATPGGILTLMQINPVQVDVHVPEKFFPSVKKGMAVEMQLDVYPDTTFAGEVFLKYPTIDPATRTFTVETTFPNPEQIIRPGMFGRVKMVFQTVERVTVPDLAVQRQQGTDNKFVFVVEKGKAKRREVRTGRRVDSFYEIISGLDVGEEVVVAGQAGLLEGNAVKVVN